MSYGSWVSENERIVWLSAFGACIAMRENSSTAETWANQAVRALRQAEPEREVVELSIDDYRQLIVDDLRVFRQDRCLRSTTYRGRHVIESREYLADGSTKATFYTIKTSGDLPHEAVSLHTQGDR